MGRDAAGAQYFVFDLTRLYRQTVRQPPQQDEVAPPPSPPANTRSSRHAVARVPPPPPPEQDLNAPFASWELLCSQPGEWRDVAERFAGVAGSGDLHQQLTDVLVPAALAALKVSGWGMRRFVHPPFLPPLITLYQSRTQPPSYTPHRDRSARTGASMPSPEIPPSTRWRPG